MQVSVEKASALERKVTVQVPADQVQKKIDARLREIGKKVRIKGFRPGRIPFKVLQQRYGKSVQQEIVAEEVQSSLLEAIEQEALRPASSPVLDGSPDLQPGGDLQFTASIEVFPEIGAIDAGAMDIEQPDCEVGDADIDAMLQTLRVQRQTWQDLDRAAQEGNQVIVEYAAETDSIRVPETGKQRIAIVMGESGFGDLEKAVSKLGPGEESKTKLKFPEGYRSEQLAGKKARVELKVLKVQEARLPEIDEDFIRSFGIESGELEDLRQEVRGNLERELRQATTTYLKRQLVSQLLDAYADLDIPEALVREEATSLMRQIAERGGTEPKSQDPGPFMDAARRRVKSGLLLGEIARQNSIMVDGARVREAIETVADTYEQPQEVVRLYYGDQRLLKSVENAVLEEQVVDWVVGQAKVTMKPMGLNEVIQAAASGGKAE